MNSSIQETEPSQLISHSKVISTMREHHQSVIKQMESNSKEALRELKGRTEEVGHLKSKVDDELTQACFFSSYAVIIGTMCLLSSPYQLHVCCSRCHIAFFR
jgi:hypothetical protein